MNETLTTLIATMQALIVLLTAQVAALPQQETSENIFTAQASSIEAVTPTTIPASFTAINNLYKDAVVNILCKGSGKFKGGTATAVAISPTGLLLTNAHIAQYMLLEQASDAPISCTIRTGNPAKALYKAKVVYMPPAWVHKYAHQIVADVQRGTGENDYTLLQITQTLKAMESNISLPEFTYIKPNPSLLSAQESQSVLIRAYPAEFLSSRSTVSSLHPVATVTQVATVATFTEEDGEKNSTIDLISLGGTIVAQGGSSGGAVINKSAELIGIIVTSTRKAETKDRNLKAITLSHINQSIKGDTDMGLTEIVALPTAELSTLFKDSLLESAKALAQAYNK